MFKMSKWKDMFDFNRRELNGSLVLAFILLLVIVFYFLIPKIITPSFIVSYEKLADLQEFSSQRKIIADSINSTNRKSYDVDFHRVDYSITTQELTPFPFNPNNLPEEEWKKMGLSDKQIKSIKNYENKGGKFRSKEDFKKMYAISDEEYAILEPFINIPVDTLPKYPKNTYSKIDFKHDPIDLNKADTFDLRKIPGIGVGLSRRIFNYRQKLGGFYDKSQLFEVFGMDSARYQTVSPYISINNAEITKININKATVKELIKHPYIDYYIAKSIVVYREEKGAFKKIEELKEATLMYDELFNKLKNYITIN